MAVSTSVHLRPLSNLSQRLEFSLLLRLLVAGRLSDWLAGDEKVAMAGA